VDKLSVSASEGLDEELDDLIAALYGFTPRERKTLFGMD
jgi:hypothetical protein